MVKRGGSLSGGVCYGADGDVDIVGGAIDPVVVLVEEFPGGGGELHVRLRKVRSVSKPILSAAGTAVERSIARAY